MFEFAVGLLLLDVHPDSLALTASYGFVRSVVLIIFGSYAGLIVRNYKRIFGMLINGFVKTCNIGYFLA